jgi:hypothetical protein
MTDELLNALKVIKAECEKHDKCKTCPLFDSHKECGVTQDIPEAWALEKREVYF